MRAIIGHSDDVETSDAIDDVIRQCRDRLGGGTPKAGLLFMSVDYEHQVVLDAIARAWPGLPVIGASSDGEVSSHAGFTMDSVLLTLLCDDQVDVHLGLGHNLSQDIDAAVAQALGAIPAGETPSLALTTFAPSTDASEVLRAINRRLPGIPCPVVGGLSGDHREFSRMLEFCGTEVLHDSLPILFLTGDITVSWGIGSGWEPIGEFREITRSAGHIIQEIDGAPALDVYKLYYGEVSQGSLGEYPLAVYEDGADAEWSLRAVLGTDAETGEVRLAGGVAPGSRVRMTEVVTDGILSGTMESVRQAAKRYPGKQPELALLFTCAARKWVLGSRAESELDSVLSELPKLGFGELDLAGLYVFGEIAPPQDGGESCLHNETCITVLIGSE